MNPSLENGHFELMESHQYYQLKVNNSSSMAGGERDQHHHQQQYSSQLDQLCSMEKKRRGAGGKRSGAGGVKLSTDPQSVAARQRRHRISDRFRILKSLVPGGSKMDTVSMLEEAIHYVKFLKAQIWLHQSATLMSTNTADHDYSRAGVPFLPLSGHQTTDATYASNSIVCAADIAGSSYSPPQVVAPHDQMSNYYMPPSFPAIASCHLQEDDIPSNPYFNY